MFVVVDDNNGTLLRLLLLFVFSSEWVACVDDVAVTVFELVLFVFRVPVLVRIVF